MLTSVQSPPAAQEARTENPTSYRTIQIDGLSIFYREAGPKDAPTLLLLHGLPSSSRMSPKTTLAPSRANVSASAAPCPRAPPLISATFPSSFPMAADHTPVGRP